MGVKPRLTLVYFDAGGGHRATMEALSEAISRSHPEWQLQTLDLQEPLDTLDFVRKWTGVRLQDRYNRVVGGPLMVFIPAALKGLQALIRVHHTRMVALLCDHWRRAPADLVVSLVPNFNRELAESVKLALPGVPFVTLLTDLADFPPHFWIEKQSQYLICGTEEAVEQASAMGHPSNSVFRVSGMTLHPRFYEGRIIDRAEERKKLALDPELPTALVQFGGQGSNVMLRIAESTERVRAPLQAIFICGRHEKVCRLLRNRNWKIPVFIEGFTSEMPRYMRISDFMIGKPGPASISEAIHCGLPVIVGCNRRIVPQERFNAHWIRKNQFGIVVKNYGRVHEAVEQIITALPQYRSAVSQIRNNALEEVVQCLEVIVRRASLQPVTSQAQAVNF